MTYEDTRFDVMFSRYGGWKRTLLSTDFVGALSVSIVVGITLSWKGLASGFVEASTVPFLTISAAMIATALAGLSIISSVSDSNYVRFARSTKVGKSSLYENVIFVFWFTSAIAFLSLFTDLAGGLMNELLGGTYLPDLFAGLMLFFVLYAIFAVVVLLNTAS